jgi:hypothetical protein
MDAFTWHTMGYGMAHEVIYCTTNLYRRTQVEGSFPFLPYLEYTEEQE